MFPLRDHNPSTRTPIVTWALIVLNVVVFVSYVDLFGNPARLGPFFDTWGMVPARVSQDAADLTFLTSMFLHGGFFHLAGNMLFLWIFGDNLEDEFGHFWFLVFYLASGLGAGLVHYVSDPLSTIPTVGASGAIAGVLGGYLLLFPKARVDILFILIIFIRIIPVPAWIMLGLWFALQLTNGVVADNAGGGVAYWAHTGGFVIGFLFTIPAWLRRGGVTFWRTTHGHPPHAEARYRRVRTGVPMAGRRTQRQTSKARGPWG
ncbi:MAG: rhomboid family intramembrane serine protease [Pseudomonadota bacterium]